MPALTTALDLVGVLLLIVALVLALWPVSAALAVGSAGVSVLVLSFVLAKGPRS